MSHTTSYVAVVGPQTAWPGRIGLKDPDIGDARKTTILLVETKNSGIHWMEPRDLQMDQMQMAVNGAAVPDISSNHSGGAIVAFADRSTRFVSEEIMPDLLRAWLTRAGGENLRLQDLYD